MPSKSKRNTKKSIPKIAPILITIAERMLDAVLIIAVFITFSLALKIAVPKSVFIPKGASNSSIVTQLGKNGVELAGFDAFLLYFMGNVQSGWLGLNEGVKSTGDLLKEITTAKAFEREVMLIPGETTIGFFTSLKAQGFDPVKLANAYQKVTLWKEGWFVPNTYRMPPSGDEETFVRYMADRSSKKHHEWAGHYLGRYDEGEWKRIIVIASIIQKEAGNVKEMPLVSSVIHNRLRKGMPLQMDGTLNYGINSHKKVTPEMIRTDLSDYNTYKHRGLPSNPVCGVSKEAIEAAIRPAHTDYLYFVRVRDGEHQFSSRYSDHLKNFR